MVSGLVVRVSGKVDVPGQRHAAGGRSETLPVTGQVWAYARVSTRDQNPQLQLDALEASGYDTLVQEKESGKRGVFRPAWQELLPLPQPGATLKFWKSDRWGRSAAAVLATVNQLRDRGVTVVSLTENFRPGHLRKAGSCSACWPWPPSTNSNWPRRTRRPPGPHRRRQVRHRGRPHPQDRALQRLHRPRRHLPPLIHPPARGAHRQLGSGSGDVPVPANPFELQLEGV
jgi:hypothetical protein